MKAFYKNNNGLFESKEWTPNCWINVECPTEEEKKYLLEDLKVPEEFYNDIEDIDERPRIEIENGWTLIIIRIPVITNNVKLPFNTIPVGIVFKGDICVTISFHKTEIAYQLSDELKKQESLEIQDDDKLSYIKDAIKHVCDYGNR